MQPVLERGSIDKPLTFDVGSIQLSFIPVCSPNTCNISVKLCGGFALQCFSLLYCCCCLWSRSNFLSVKIVDGEDCDAVHVVVKCHPTLAIWHVIFLLCCSGVIAGTRQTHIFYIIYRTYNTSI